MIEDELLARIIGISEGNYLNVIFNEMTITDWYEIGGKASLWSNGFHYCDNKAAKEIIKSERLRFTNVKDLDDKTEFYNIMDIINKCLQEGDFKSEFRDYILKSEQFISLLNGEPFYIGRTVKNQDYHKIYYKTYTCSLSYTENSEYMWKEYAKDPDGIAIHFSDISDMFVGTNSNGITERNRFEDGMKLSRGIVFYDDEYKRKCTETLLNEVFVLYTEAIRHYIDYLPQIQNAFVCAINNMRSFFKINEEKYKKETEYRYSISFPFEKEGEIKNTLIDYNKVSDTEKDQIDIKFKKNKIVELWVNPSCGNEYINIQSEMSDLLDTYGYIGVEVIDSAKSRLEV